MCSEIKGGVLVKKIIRNLYLMSFLLLICSLTGCRSAPLCEVTIVPYDAINEETTFEFNNLMGYSGYYLDVPSLGRQIHRSYYAENGMPIAVTFGYPEYSSDIIKDITGDGVTELIANVRYGDGAQRVEIWRMREGSVEVGRVDQSLYDEFYAVYRSISEYYDPTQGRIQISFNSDDMTKTITWEWDDFSHFSFEPPFE